MEKMLILPFLLSCFLAITSAATEKKVVCYYANWSLYREGRGGFNVDHIDPMLCTHVIYAYVAVRDKGTIVPFDKFSKKPSEKNGFYEFSCKLREINPEVKIMVALGGYHEGSRYFSQAIAKPSFRKQLIHNIMNFLIKYNFHGLDIDWMYPGQVSRGGKERDKKNYILLLKELRKVFDHENLILSAAVGATENIAKKYYLISELAKYLHFINLMTYDLHGKLDGKTGLHSPLYTGSWENKVDSQLNIHDSVQYWISQGAPPEKLVLGVPLYGISFTLKNSQNLHIIGSPATAGYPGKFTNESGLLGYNEICDYIIHDKWQVYYQNEQRTPYAVKGHQWVGYDDKRSISEKVAYANYYGLGGLMVWSLDTDDFQGDCGEKYPLLKAINEIRNINFDQVVEVPEKSFEIQEPATEEILAPILPNNNLESKNNNQEQIVQDELLFVTDENIFPNTTPKSENIILTTDSKLKPIPSLDSDAESYEGIIEKGIILGFDSKTNSSLQGKKGDINSEKQIASISTTDPPFTDLIHANNESQTMGNESFSDITKETSNIECIEISEANKSENENDTTEVYLEDITGANHEITITNDSEFDESSTELEMSQTTTLYQEITTVIPTLTTSNSNEKFEKEELENSFSTVVDTETTTDSSSANIDSNSKSNLDSREDISEEEYEQELQNGTSTKTDIEIVLLPGNKDNSIEPIIPTPDTSFTTSSDITLTNKESKIDVTVLPTVNSMTLQTEINLDQNGKTHLNINHKKVEATKSEESILSSTNEVFPETEKSLSPSHKKEKVTPSPDNHLTQITNGIEFSGSSSATSNVECIEIPNSIIQEYENKTTEAYIDISTDSETTKIYYHTDNESKSTELISTTIRIPLNEIKGTNPDGKLNAKNDSKKTQKSDKTTLSNEKNDFEVGQTKLPVTDSTTQIFKENFNKDVGIDSETNQSNGENDIVEDKKTLITTIQDLDTTSTSNDKENDEKDSENETSTLPMIESATEQSGVTSNKELGNNLEVNQSNDGSDNVSNDPLSKNTSGYNEKNSENDFEVGQTKLPVTDSTTQIFKENFNKDVGIDSETNQSNGENDIVEDKKTLITTIQDLDTTSTSNDKENDEKDSENETSTLPMIESTTEQSGVTSNKELGNNLEVNQSNDGSDNVSNDPLSKNTSGYNEKNSENDFEVGQTKLPVTDSTTQIFKENFNKDVGIDSETNQSNGENDIVEDKKTLITTIQDLDTTSTSNDKENDEKDSENETSTLPMIESTTKQSGVTSNKELGNNLEVNQSNDGSDNVSNDPLSKTTSSYNDENSEEDSGRTKTSRPVMDITEEQEEIIPSVSIASSDKSNKNLMNIEQENKRIGTETSILNGVSNVTNGQFSDNSSEKTVTPGLSAVDVSSIVSSGISEDNRTSLKDFDGQVTNSDFQSEVHSESNLSFELMNSDDKITSTTKQLIFEDSTNKQSNIDKNISDLITTNSPLSTISSIHDVEDNSTDISHNENPCDNQLIPGIAANPVDCSSFYKCQRTYSGTYMPFKIRCPDDLLFNAKIFNCDRAKNVVCPNKYSSNNNYESNSGTTIDPLKKIFIGNPCNNQLIPGIALDPAGCSTFYKCQKAPGAGWIPFKLYCPSGLLFNRKIFVCDWPNNIQCHI